MSEQPPEGGQGARKPPAGKKIGPLTRNQAIGVGIAGVIVLGVIVWRRRKAAQNQAQTAATAAAGQSGGAGVGTCPDGSTVDCGGLCPDGSTPTGCDQSGQLSTLQTELGQLESALAQGQGGGGSGSGGVSTVPVTGDGTGTGTGTTTSPPSTGTTAPAPSGTTNPAPLAPGPAAGKVTGLTATKVGKTTATVRWAAAPGATGGYSYVVRDLSVHRDVNEGVTHNLSVNLSNLKSKTTFNFGIQALPGGAGTNIHFTTT